MIDDTFEPVSEQIGTAMKSIGSVATVRALPIEGEQRVEVGDQSHTRLDVGSRDQLLPERLDVLDHSPAELTPLPVRTHGRGSVRTSRSGEAGKAGLET